MRPTAPENFNGDAATNRLDPTWKAQVDSRRKRRMHSCSNHCTFKLRTKFRLMALRTVAKVDFCRTVDWN